MKICDVHDWVVFSVATGDWDSRTVGGNQQSLLVQCVECGMQGAVEDPTEDEWGWGCMASTHPYRWTDDVRVISRGFRTKEFYIQHGPQDSVEPTPYWQQVQQKVKEDVKRFRDRERH